MDTRSLFLGAGAAVVARAALSRMMRFKLERDVERLNRGDYQPLLAGFADDAVLHFHRGPHRFAGPHIGKAAIETFLRNFVSAGLRGELGRIWVAGPPWALEICVRFDDHAEGPSGRTIYANHTILWARTRWGKIVEQRDFFEDTGRILALEEELTTRGQPAVTSPGSG